MTVSERAALIPYVLGGSIASSFFGEPGSAVDTDLVVRLDGDRGEGLLELESRASPVPSAAQNHAETTVEPGFRPRFRHAPPSSLVVLGPWPRLET